MSGSIGADRIPRAAVQLTLDWYVENVLKNFKGYKSAKITGSYNAGLKKDHGDIDLTLWVEGDDVKKIKKEFKEYLESLPDNVTVPFKAGKRKGDKAQMFGSIVTCAVPMQGFEGLSVQIDNNIVLSEIEQRFNSSFLDLPAEKQALLMGLVRVILMEENPEKVFARLGIKKLPLLEKNQEFEFVLSGTGLTLRKVTLDGFKEVNREVVWSSRDWSDVERLLRNYDLNADFDTLLGTLASSLKNPRSRRRVVGIMSSMINVGPGEVGTPKGDNKQRAIDVATSKLGSLEEEVTEPKGTIALYGGGFKPPHKAHFANAEKLSKNADRLIIFIGSKVREGVPITAEQSKRVWDIYKKYIHIPVEVRIAEKSPIGSIYDLIGNPELQGTKFVIGKSQEGAEEDKKFAYLIKNQDKYPNVTLKSLPVIVDKEDQKFSASTLRKSIESLRKVNWIPDCLDRDDARKVLDTVITPLEQQAIQEEIKAKMTKVLAETLGLKEGNSGAPIAPASVISSKHRSSLGKLYLDLDAQLGQNFTVKFNQSNIVITPKYASDLSPQGYDPEQAPGSMNENEGDGLLNSDEWTKHAAGLIKYMRKNGMKLDPLPDIVLNKSQQSGGLLDKTGDYNPADKVITVYTKGRSLKDSLRTLSHELVHSEQDNDGRLGTIRTDKTSDGDGELNELEKEAYERGNMLFRGYTESLGK